LDGTIDAIRNCWCGPPRLVGDTTTSCRGPETPRVRAGFDAIASQRPIQLAETSSAEAGGSKAQWIEQMFAYLAHHPEVTSVIWFNLVKETNWRIDSSPSAERAFAAGARAAWVI
jgi:hypothetical protein